MLRSSLQLSVTNSSCHALAERNAVPNVPLDIKGLILVLIERPHIGRRQLLHSAYINGSRVEHNRHKFSGVTVKVGAAGFLPLVCATSNTFLTL